MLIGITIVIQLIIVHVNCLQKYQFISLFLMFLNRPRNVLGLLTTCVWQREERGMKKLIMKIEQDKIYIYRWVGSSKLQLTEGMVEHLKYMNLTTTTFQLHIPPFA